jgi:peptide/nickel transport system substrate-binding protein
MSKAWCEKNARESRRTTREGGHDHARARPTARAVHAEVARARREDGARKNPNWWGIKAGSSTATSTTSCTRRSSPTRRVVAALISGEVDLINDPPPQDVPRLKQTPTSR